jgi:RNA polymerase sigma factor (sigma-70 family)
VSGRPEIEGLLRESAPQALAALMRRFRDFGDCEDAVQEALLAAAQQWPHDGTPENPVGWLAHVASRRMIDQLRSDEARRTRESLAESPREGGPHYDDTLVLMLLSCHQALTPASAIALTLRAVGGLTTAEVARAFFVPEATMAQRISRAKSTLRSAGVAMPEPAQLPERLRSILHVLYLIFNEGYLTSSGPELARAELSGEAIRLTRAVHRALPDDPEVAGLLALMLLTEARRPGRTTADGELVPLAEQDRSLWNRDQIDEGAELIRMALGRGAAGEYQLQAAIAAVHGRATRHEDTDWREIVGIYGLLEQMTGNPMVGLNRAIAAAMADGPAVGLALLEPLEEPLAGHHRLFAARAHLLEMAGQPDAAVADYRTAAARTTSIPEQHYLLTQAARLGRASPR